MAESSSGTFEERPKVNWFLWVAAAFFVILIMAVWELPNVGMKWAWMGIAVLNLSANVIQINNTRMTRYVLWKRGLSIYMGQSREALIRFDKALMFRPFRGLKDAKEDTVSFGVTGPIRSYPAFGGRRRWLVIFENEDGTVRALVFDPTPVLEDMFRSRLIAVERTDAADADAPAEAAGSPPVPEDAGWEDDDHRPEPDGGDVPDGTPGGDDAVRPKDGDDGDEAPRK